MEQPTRSDDDKKASRVLTYADAHPVVVDLLLLRAFGMSYLVWEPETLWREILLDLRRHLSRSTKDKIQAIRLVHNQSMPFDEYPAFEKVVQAFNGNEVMFHVMQPPTLPFLLAGVDAMQLIRRQPLGDEVLRYCAAVLLNEGVEAAPSPVDGASKFLKADAQKQGRILSMAASPTMVLGDSEMDVQARKVREAVIYRNRVKAAMVSQLSEIR